jgi:hypothetical protein
MMGGGKSGRHLDKWYELLCVRKQFSPVRLDRKDQQPVALWREHVDMLDKNANVWEQSLGI